MSLFAELKRRNVIRVAAAYLAGSWLLIQIADTVFPAYGLPGSALSILITVLAIGLLPAIIISWAFEWTPQGLRRDADVAPGESVAPQAGKRLDRAIIVVLAIAIGFFAVDKFALDPARDEALQQRAEERGRAAALVESYGDKSIAVLPFADMSPEGDQAYFSDGIAEEILNLLAKVRDLRVISRSSAFRYRGDGIHIPTVAEELNVNYVLEGSVRKAGDTLRITAQLIDARTDTHVWSETYDRRFDDVFAIQDEISEKIFAQLNATLLGEAPTVARTDPEAYALYLQARHLLEVRNFDERTAETLLAQALELDPTYVPALNAMVVAVYGLTGPGEGDLKYTRDEGIELMRSYVDRALAIDPDNAHANAHRGWMAWFYNNDLETAVSYLQRALDEDPHNERVLFLAAVISRRIGRNEDAIAFAEAGLARDPLCSDCLYTLMLANVRLGKYEEALDASKRRMRVATGGWLSRGEIHLLMGDAQTALELFDNQKQDRLGWLAYRALAYHELGNTAERDAALDELSAIDVRRAQLAVAEVHASMGNVDEAFAWIARGLDPDAPEFVQAAPGVIWNPRFKILHDDPRWLELRRQAGLDPEILAGIRLLLPDQ
jgi:adenylate cyclase